MSTIRGREMMGKQHTLFSCFTLRHAASFFLSSYFWYIHLYQYAYTIYRNAFKLFFSGLYFCLSSGKHSHEHITTKKCLSSPLREMNHFIHARAFTFFRFSLSLSPSVSGGECIFLRIQCRERAHIHTRSNGDETPPKIALYAERKTTSRTEEGEQEARKNYDMAAKHTQHLSSKHSCDGITLPGADAGSCFHSLY